MAVTATLLQPKKEDVYLTNAEIIYSSSADLPPNYSSSTQQINYSDLVYKWNFSDGESSTDQNSTHNFINLNLGAENILSGTVTITCTQTIINQDLNGQSEPIINTNYLIGTATSSILVYTRPGSFTKYNFNKENPIHEQLTVEITKDWCKHCEKYLSWKKQENKYNSIDINIYAGKSGEAISADLFNKQITIAEVELSSAIKDETLLSIEFFKNLGNAISKTDVD